MTASDLSEATTASQSQHEQELRAATRVTVIGMVLDAVLGLVKCVAGAIFHSQALIVDGIHSFSDVASDFLVLGVMRVSRQAPDQEHPYGHQRFETLGTMILGSLLIAVGAALAWDNVHRLLTESGDIPLPEWPVLAAAIASVLGKEWIYRYTRRVGLEIRSDLIIANAWHSRTDAFSSVIVVISTAGAMLGYVWLDALAAVIVAIIIARVGWHFTWNSVKELVDTALSPEDTAELARIARETEGVRSVHELRSRRMGGDVLVDIHLQVSPQVSVSEGHQIGVQVVRRIRVAFEDIRDITFHIDAENDEEGRPTSPELPTRNEVRQALADCWGGLPAQSDLRLHYLGDHVHVELCALDPEEFGGQESEASLASKLSDLDWLGSFRAWRPMRD